MPSRIRAFRRSLLERGFQPIGSTTDEFRAHVDREIDKWITDHRGGQHQAGVAAAPPWLIVLRR